MANYQISSVTDSKVEVGNYAMYVAASAGTSVGGTWVPLGSGMLKDFAYVAENFTSQAGNSVDPIEGIAKETATFSFDLLEYDGSSFSLLSGGAMTGTSGSLIVGGRTSIVTPRGFKLVNTRKKATGSSQTTIFVIESCTLQNGWTMTPKSDNDTDPVNVYSFSMLAELYGTTSVLSLFTKTVG
jgi:hypothetical protein